MEPFETFRIWDVHTHYSGPGDTPGEILGSLLRHADRVGIDRVCVHRGVPGPKHYNPPPDDIRRQNDEAMEGVEQHAGRAFGFVYLNPNYPTFSVEELNRCVAHGPMVGIKLWVAAKCDIPGMDPIVRRATELDIPILQHTYLKVGGDPPNPGGANLSGESTPMNMANLAERHPDAKLICGHTGADWEIGLRAIRPYENVRVGIAGFDPTAMVVERAVELLGADRIVYGSDSAGRSFGSQMAKVIGANISGTHKQMILKDNLHNMLRPILREKGMDVD